MPDESLQARAREIQRRFDAIPHIRVSDAKQLFEAQGRPLDGSRELSEQLAAANPSWTILILELEKTRLELELEKANRRIERMQHAPKWLQPAGICFGAFTLLFFMLIVVLGIVGYAVPPSTKFALVAVLALGSAFSAAAWIG